MSLLNYLIFAVAAMVLAYYFYTMRQMRRMRGENVAEIINRSGLAMHNGRLLLYFHATGCAPCRYMTPIINEMHQHYPWVHNLNVREHLALAQQLGVRATPTTMLIQDAHIVELLIGRQTRNKLMSLIGA